MKQAIYIAIMLLLTGCSEFFGSECRPITIHPPDGYYLYSDIKEDGKHYYIRLKGYEPPDDF